MIDSVHKYRELRVSNPVSLAGVWWIASLLFILTALPVATGEEITSQRSHVQGTVGRIIITGNRAVPTGTLLEWLGLREGDEFTTAIGEGSSQRLLEQYQRTGFLKAEIRGPSIQGAGAVDGLVLEYTVDEGDLFLLGAVHVRGNSVLSKQSILSMMDTRKGDVFDPVVLDRDAATILAWYEDNGYPYASVSPGGFFIGGGALEMTVVVDEGPEVRIDSVEIEGNEHTQDRLILRTIDLRDGARYRQSVIDRIHLALMELGLFEQVEEVEILPTADPGRVRLRLVVREGKSSAVLGAIGYSKNQDGLTGLVDLTLGNLGGRARRARVRWHRWGSESYDWLVAILEPYLLWSSLTVDLRVQQTVRDSTSVLTQGAIGITLPIDRWLSGSLHVAVDRAVPGTRKDYAIRRSSRVRVQLLATADDRDFAPNPRSGYLASGGWEQQYKKYATSAPGEPATVNASVATLELGAYHPLGLRHVMAVEGFGGGIFSDEELIPVHEQFAIGGANTLRGYEQDQFHGSQVALGTLEYRYLLGTRSRAHLFLDLGYYQRKQPQVEGGTEQVSDGLVGYGMGLRMESGLGILGVDFGLGQEDKLREGKVHLRLETQF